jgi:hypothetical protein
VVIVVTVLRIPNATFATAILVDRGRYRIHASDTRMSFDYINFARLSEWI